VKIVAIAVCPLTGGTVDGGWPQGHEPQENLHTLLIVTTDEGLVGLGSCYTSGKLTAGAIELLWPLLRHQSAVEPERVSETLRQSSFWQGRGGRARHQRHRYRTLGPDGQGLRPTCLATAGRQLPGNDQAVRVDTVRRARPAAQDADQCAGAWIPGNQAGLAAIRPARPQV
jgi:hypothetical protein